MSQWQFYIYSGLERSAIQQTGKTKAHIQFLAKVIPDQPLKQLKYRLSIFHPASPCGMFVPRFFCQHFK